MPWGRKTKKEIMLMKYKTESANEVFNAHQSLHLCSSFIDIRFLDTVALLCCSDIDYLFSDMRTWNQQSQKGDGARKKLSTCIMCTDYLNFVTLI